MVLVGIQYRVWTQEMQTAIRIRQKTLNDQCISAAGSALESAGLFSLVQFFPFILSTDGPGKRHQNKEQKSNRKARPDMMLFIQAVVFSTKTIGFFILIGAFLQIASL